MYADAHSPMQYIALSSLFHCKGSEVRSRYLRIERNFEQDGLTRTHPACAHCQGHKVLFYNITYSDSLVEASGLEPLTSCLQSRRSPN